MRGAIYQLVRQAETDDEERREEEEEDGSDEVTGKKERKEEDERSCRLLVKQVEQNRNG